MTPTPTRRRPFPLWPVVLALGLVGFGVGLAQLLALRLEAGDVYPPYSTLRADALGTKALFAALEDLPDVRVERNYRPLKKLFAPPLVIGGHSPAATTEGAKVSPRGATLFFLGLPPWRWPYSFTGVELDQIEDLARRGARVVLTFQPSPEEPTTQALVVSRKQTDEARRRLEEEPNRADGERGAKDKKEEKPEKKPDGKLSPQFLNSLHVDAAARWGLDFHRVRLDSVGKMPPGYTPPPSVSLAVPAGPMTAEIGSETLSWHSAADLELDPRRTEVNPAGWQPLLTRNRGRAVAAVRSFGEGSIVLATDSFFLSNEALRDERHPALLAGLIGAQARRVVFDEQHFGLSEDPGMMTLARRYRLGGVLAALGVLAGLFLWKSGTSLAPPRVKPEGELAGAELVAGREASAGFLALLRRSVPAAELIRTCLARWEASPAHPVTEAKRARLRELAATAGTAPARTAETYRAMAEVLRRRE